MHLSKENLSVIQQQNPNIEVASDTELPEKVLQFGTGVLLRGLPDYFIDKANKQGVFNGRVVVVKSTGKGGTNEFASQDGLYTICVRGVENNQHIEQDIISSAISRVLTANSEWDSVLEFASNPDFEIVISNTTEVGIQLVEDDVHAQPPVSFPGKLLAVLLKRYQTFNGDPAKGLVILPTELISNNGTLLKEIVLKLAQNNNLDAGFIKWVSESNYFCNTLVDRIVPGKPEPEFLEKFQNELGYQDDLLIVAEAYKLWAIEGNEEVKKRLSFAKVDPGVIVTHDIDIYRELKLRLLNGTHTLSCGLAFLAGCETVKQAMDDEKVSAFISNLMIEDIAPAIPYTVENEAAVSFANVVLDRFRNPQIKHFWISITMNYSTKLGMRVVPVLQKYYEIFNQVPQRIALGFAAYILFTKPQVEEGGKYYGIKDGKKYLIDDNKASLFYDIWKSGTIKEVVEKVLSNRSLWSADLTQLPGFAEAVESQLQEIQSAGVMQTLSKIENKKISV